MLNHYKTLGLTNAASSAEVRRAYRILARRYHPDVNPDGKSEALFKEIASAYAVLSDPEKKQQYDLELKQSAESFHQTFERAHEALRRSQQGRAYARQQRPAAPKSEQQRPASTQGATRRSSRSAATVTASTVKNSPQIPTALKHFRVASSAVVMGLKRTLQAFNQKENDTGERPATNAPNQLTLVELSISMRDAITGVKKTVEVSENEPHSRKLSVNIPPGVRTGSVVRLRSKERADAELVLVIRVETHPWLSLGDRGITMEIPLTISEAMNGAKVQVPAFGDPLLVTVEPGTQSGKEVRLKGQGLMQRDGTRGDLYIRFIVKIPDTPLSPQAQKLTEACADSYTTNVRAHLPRRILE